MEAFEVIKVLNNNVVIASNSKYEEVVLIGKGIGFNRKKGSSISKQEAEKLFVLKGEVEQIQYKKLLPFIDEDTLEVIISANELIRKRTEAYLDEHIHIALTDHILFAINRLMKGMAIKNPFNLETKVLYPDEYEIAREVVEMINDTTNIQLPEGEIGFIALHIHSAVTNKNLAEINQYSQLIAKLISTIEEQFGIKLNKDEVNYMRLVRHLRYTIDRVLSGEKVNEPKKITSFLKQEYPLCYNLAWKLIKIMQQTLKKPVFDAEAVYLTMHLQRIQNKIK
ncbi:PRD domain-containing protein [Bacillus sporothermodurans]|uniref:glucose PTS transporter transcription antiterminator GlcT n=1 Tax=Heyndrickxia sporothermodurans TaxID=46224 RepID=UPI00192CB75B|nr:PRD domain-containing protein [Heyndrickxia sporothermodurans]MBL5767922.1 PRD domain-containing protein [Heyndrickxia sporothermodurans]MBL5771373.1 PRD domain-containing protein [Heyndrickxia sporothermodurans]MBL5775070.1 PRD domain-containing protein [Heyndrickxia sporothermodurans]MBL5779899.1 PRD domain-containing protein [Heyndrickxia sporothermodurans]MBL5782051.1 PRD domain-containing protein [Heyndrickxia sporothermodurans]